MAGYEVRSLADISRGVRGLFTQSIPGAITSLWANTFVVIGKVIALLVFEQEQRRAWLFRQIFASTADTIWLQRHGFELGLTLDPGNAALGRISMPAPSGMVVPSGLAFLRDDGTGYTSLTGAVAVNGAAVLLLEADAVGALSNATPGTALSLAPDAAAPVGLGTAGTVLAEDDGTGISGGLDAEPIEAFRARVLARKRNPPHGGAVHDYETWVREALPGIVLAVWVDSFANDARSVWVQFTVADQPDAVPSAVQVAQVQAYLDDTLRRPVTARVFVSAPQPVPVSILVAGLSPDTPDIRASIWAEIRAVFTDRAEPGKPMRGNFVLSRSWLSEAISRATGEDRHRLVSPAADLTFGAGLLPVPGPVAYTD